MKINIEQTTIKDLTDKAPRLMGALHEGYGFDFMDDYRLYKIEGRFTAKSLTPYAHAGEVAVIMMRGNTWSNTTCMYLVGYRAEYEEFNIYVNTGDYPNPFRTFYYNSDFEDFRKYEHKTSWLLIQKRHEKHTPDVDEYGRFKVVYDDDEIESIYPYGFDGRVTKYGKYYIEYDKSGYPVELYRARLQEKAKEIREKKAQEEYLKTDNSDKIATLERLLGNYKEKLAKQVTAVKTVDDVYELDKHLGYMGLRDIIDDFATFKRNTEEKSFPSIDASNALYDRIAKRIYEYI